MFAFLPLALSFFSASPAAAQDAPPVAPLVEGDVRVYQVEQTVKLSDIPAKAKNVRWWVSIPDNERMQELLDFEVVSAPGAWRIERDAERGNRFLYVEVNEPTQTELEAVVRFTLRRHPMLVRVDPAKVGAITAGHRQLYPEEVRRDAPHMEVTPEIEAMAKQACGAEQNPAKQTALLLQLVADKADHYSKDPSKPHCGVGDADDCLTNGGGCCTDLHSLFIALARARGIPARLQMGYRLNPKKANESYDPGYRCWVEYFLPNYGWVPSDIVEADAPGGMGAARWFTGLTEWRLWLNEGREFKLRPTPATVPVNTMVIGHAEIDGRPARVLPEGELAPQLTRRVRYTELR